MVLPSIAPSVVSPIQKAVPDATPINPPSINTLPANDYELDPDIFKLTYSSTGQLQHKEKFALEVNGYFQSKTFNLLGTGIGNFKMPIYAPESGVSEVWVR